MRRTTLITTALVLGATMAQAETFEPAPYLAEHGVQVLTREAANELVDRDLFGLIQDRSRHAGGRGRSA